MHDMITAGINGDSTTCLAINEQLATLHKALFIEANPIAAKWALNRLGKADIGIRLPLVPLDEAYQPTVEAALKQANLI